ncbi:MAG: hypothetical protein EOO29_28430 [Comamonadaceae bacterium]|nr:MAG: hypothetical protein EOO29_28430 [Comamonadaceae bacterium]
MDWSYHHTAGGQRWQFDGLRDVLGKASPLRSGDVLAGIAAAAAVERMAARMCLADVPLASTLLLSFVVSLLTKLL